jgi:hypothetical protein
MTPKDKAKELIDKFYDLPIILSTAKDCALITCDEIINKSTHLYSIKYWQQVKQEIQAL